jgi:hypothetical protein
MATLIASIMRRVRAAPWVRVIAGGALLVSGNAVAQIDDGASEIEVKAAFVYKFMGYVEWPRHSLAADAPLVIGVAGAEDIAGELSRIVTARTIQGRSVTVRPINAPAELNGVQVLFIGADAVSRMPRLIEAARERPILIVTDAPDGLEHGAMINFVRVKRRVQFEIAVAPAERAGLTLSSRLLAVALRVKKGGLEMERLIARLERPAFSVTWCTACGNKFASVSFV